MRRDHTDNTNDGGGLKPGAIYDRYRLIQQLGEGGMATVWLAEMTGAGGFSKRVALKLVKATGYLPPEFNQWFISEARLGGLLNHPNIVQTLDFGDTQGRLFLAMEYLDGPSLDRIIDLHRSARLPIPTDVAVQILVEVCHGLEHAHKATDNSQSPLNIVHRDMKPSNILLNRYGNVKIADFGVARASTNLVHTLTTGSIKGTAQYMSPEQAWGMRDLDRRSDLFSLGLILFELLTLKPFYVGTSIEMLLRRAQDAEIQARLELLPEGPGNEVLKVFFTRALAREPGDRFQTAGEMARSLRELLHVLGSHWDIRQWFAETFEPTFMDNPGASGGLHTYAGPEIEQTLAPALDDPLGEQLPDLRASAWGLTRKMTGGGVRVPGADGSGDPETTEQGPSGLALEHPVETVEPTTGAFEDALTAVARPLTNLAPPDDDGPLSEEPPPARGSADPREGDLPPRMVEEILDAAPPVRPEVDDPSLPPEGILVGQVEYPSEEVLDATPPVRPALHEEGPADNSEVDTSNAIIVAPPMGVEDDPPALDEPPPPPEPSAPLLDPVTAAPTPVAVSIPEPSRRGRGGLVLAGLVGMAALGVFLVWNRAPVQVTPPAPVAVVAPPPQATLAPAPTPAPTPMATPEPPTITQAPADKPTRPNNKGSTPSRTSTPPTRGSADPSRGNTPGVEVAPPVAPPVNTSATLVLNSRPSATISIDGAKVGSTDPKAVDLAVRTGQHIITFESSVTGEKLTESVMVPERGLRCVAYFDKREVSCQ